MMKHFPSIKCKCLCIGLITFIGIGISHAVQVTVIEAFSLTEKPFEHIPAQASTCYVDNNDNSATTNLEKLNRQLQASQQDVASFVKEHKTELQNIMTSAHCKMRADALGLQKLPAIVFDKQFVFYGEQNIERTLLSYKEYKKAELALEAYKG